MIISSILLKTISCGGILCVSWKETGLHYFSIMVKILSNSRGEYLKYMYMDIGILHTLFYGRNVIGYSL